MAKDKLFNYYLRKARSDTKLGQRNLKNKKYMAMASEMSKDLMKEYASVSAKIRARKSADYLKYRAEARYGLYNQVLDRPAKRQYERITKTSMIK